MPKPLVQRLALTLLVGTGCFFIGLTISIYEKDMVFLALSLILLCFTLYNSISLYIMIKKKSYYILAGVCTEIHYRTFCHSIEVTVEDFRGEAYHLILNKRCRIHTGISYRFYFRSTHSFVPGNRLIEKAFMTNNFLGMETAEAPSSGNSDSETS